MNNFTIFNNSTQSNSPLEFTIPEGKTHESFVTVQNNDSQTQTFELFVQNAKLNQENKLDFINEQNTASSPNQWLKLSQTNITLEPGQSAEIPFKLSIPETANRGDHHSIIIAKPINAETPENPVTIVNQKGVHIISHVPGDLNAQIALISERQVECGSQLCFDYTFQNQGTTEGSSQFSFKAINPYGKTLFSEKKQLDLDRNEQQKIHIQWQPPFYGEYTTLVETSPLTPQTTILHPPQNNSFTFFPFFEFAIALLILFIGTSIFARHLSHFKKLFKNRQKLQFATFSILIISGIFFIQTILPPNQSLFAQNDYSTLSSENYLTLQWGNVRQALLPQKEKNREWNFEISIDNGQMYIDSHLDFEGSDLTTFTNENQTLQVNTITNDEVDGMILMIQSTKAESPTITFTDLESGEQSSYQIQDLLTEQRFISGRQSLHILASDTYFKAKRFYIYSQDDPLSEILDATGDISALLELPASPEINVEEVTRIFALLPATYEAFTELRPSYDLISKVVAASGQVQVFADPIFISEIAASPELLTEIAASPSRNFSFIPNRKLVFPSQAFDFSSQKILSLPIDEILFTHQKSGKITTYVQSSDFVSLSNENTITANNLCIIPGDIEWITNQANNYFIQEKYCFKSSTDQTYLVERFIGAPTTFMMRPTLELKIPEGTKPSTYRGILTFTEI